MIGLCTGRDEHLGNVERCEIKPGVSVNQPPLRINRRAAELGLNARQLLQVVKVFLVDMIRGDCNVASASPKVADGPVMQDLGRLACLLAAPEKWGALAHRKLAQLRQVAAVLEFLKSSLLFFVHRSDCLTVVRNLRLRATLERDGEDRVGQPPFERLVVHELLE